MSDLFWPGDERAEGLLDNTALLDAMVQVEQAWIDALVQTGVAPEAAGGSTLHGLVGDGDIATLSANAAAAGNPVVALVALLRERTDGEVSRWLHRGLTSQDVIDTALVLLVRDALSRIDRALRMQLTRLADLATSHRDDPAVARTMTQHAVPLTVGMKFATWITSLADAWEEIDRVRGHLVLQTGGAAGTLAATVELAGSPAAALEVVEHTGRLLDLRPASPWHTARSPVTRIGDALVSCTDAWGRVATDVATLSRPEIAEVSEDAGGGSSTMPQKKNPVLAVLLRRAALAAPGLSSTLHLAAATTVDERSDGAWHAEWATLRLLARRTVVAASQATDLLADLQIHTDQMRTNLEHASGVDAEQRAMAGLTGRVTQDPAYTGMSGVLIDAAVRRAREIGEERS